MQENEKIEVIGARVHNLKNIDVTIPRDALTVVTGLSGSGKSSLAFDTIFAEGQRRYIETFSAYARNMLGNMEKPDVDQITGLSPVISIEQKTTNRNPRSTVGTITEVYDYLRLLYARAGQPVSYLSGEPMVKYTEDQIIDMIIEQYQGKRIYLLAPVVMGRKGHYRDLFESVRRKGYLQVRADGEIRDIIFGMKLDRYKNHDVEVVVDKLVCHNEDYTRVRESVQKALKIGEGLVFVLDASSELMRRFSKRLMCPVTGLAYDVPAPHSFSFNSPKGYCPKCKGLGEINQVDVDLVIPDRRLSIAQGGIAPLGKTKSFIMLQIASLLAPYDADLNTPIENFPDDLIEEIIYGSSERIKVTNPNTGKELYTEYDGVAKYIQDQITEDAPKKLQNWAEQFSKMSICPECQGKRLNKVALHYFIDDKNIADLSQMDVITLHYWLSHVEERLSNRQQLIAHEIIKEITTRLSFLLDVGVGYLSLNRTSRTLSGGESQRIRLATQVGSQLVNVLYILDEPSIGLHQRDNIRLIRSLEQLRDAGNSIIVVEHDKDMMLSADWILDLGPKAGRHGGELVYMGTPQDMLHTDTMTAQYLNGKMEIPMPAQRSLGDGTKISLLGASGNNLKHIDVDIPLGLFLCVTGVSGSGKSTLVNGTLQPILSKHYNHSLKDPLPYDRIEGIENIDKVITVDQSPIGRSSRSTPATYTGVFDDIRTLFVSLPEAKIRAYTKGRFSYNVGKGRCEECKGLGYRVVEMNFLPDVHVPCHVCNGLRYNRETMEVRYKGKSIGDVLEMSVNEAVDFFEHIPSIAHKIKMIQEVGLGYIKLGQNSTTLSGGESQRIKLATELSRKDTGNTLYILDEPTTGLHFEDIRILVDVLRRLVEAGNTVLVIEHNLDVIRIADYIIDVGPEGGQAGGQVIATGTPEEIAQNTKSYTASFLKEELSRFKPVKAETKAQMDTRLQALKDEKKQRFVSLRKKKED